MSSVLTPRRRTRARRLVLGTIVVALGTLVVAPVVRRTWRRAPSALAISDGWTVRGVHRLRVDEARSTLELSAGEVHVERSRFGMFRIGVAHTLSAHDVRIDVHTHPGEPSPAAPRGSPRAHHDARRAPGVIATVRLDGVELHLDGAGREHLDLRAERCEVNFLRGERLICHRAVHLRGHGIDHRFTELEYDLARRRFTAGAAPQSTDAAVAELNATVARLAPPDLDTVRARLAALR